MTRSVLDEDGLRREVAGPAVTCEQLDATTHVYQRTRTDQEQRRAQAFGRGSAPRSRKTYILAAISRPRATCTPTRSSTGCSRCAASSGSPMIGRGHGPRWMPRSSPPSYAVMAAPSRRSGPSRAGCASPSTTADPRYQRTACANGSSAPTGGSARSHRRP
jgi:hypothetical protein